MKSVVSDLSKTSKTETGPTKQSLPDIELIDAINQAFAVFRINYHNQYYKAFNNSEEDERFAKRLWLSELKTFTPEVIVAAAKRLIVDSEFMPNLHKMTEYCRLMALPSSLPSVRQAYLEACLKPSPKDAQSWSHPIVYLAGKLTGWYELASLPENKTYDVFKTHFSELCQRQLQGEQFEVPAAKQLEQQPHHPLDKQQNAEKLEQLRQQLKL